VIHRCACVSQLIINDQLSLLERLLKYNSRLKYNSSTTQAQLKPESHRDAFRDP